MSASTLTAKTAKKTTTKREKPDHRATEINRLEATRLADADKLIETARAKAAGHPQILSAVEAWAPLKLAEAKLDAAHSYEDEFGQYEDDYDKATNLWHAALAAAAEGAKQILALSAASRAEATAKVDVYLATQGNRSLCELDICGDVREMIEGLIRDLETPAIVADSEAPSKSEIAEMTAERLALETRLAATTTDAESGPLVEQISALEARILSMPCTSNDVAIAKLVEARRALVDDGPLGGEEAAIDQVVRYLRQGTPVDAPGACPVAALADEVEAALHDEASGKATAYQRIIALEEPAASMQAISMEGTALQLAFAMHQAELVRGNPDQAVRDAYAENFERLMGSAMCVLSGHVSPMVWSAYVGGKHPGASQVAAPPAVPSVLDLDLLSLGRELERRWARERGAEAQDLPDEEFNAICAETSHIAELIQATPARTIPGLRVKARAALWCQGDGSRAFELWPISSSSKVVDCSLAASIVNDLLANPAQPIGGADAPIIEAALAFKALSYEFDDTGNDRIGGPNEADLRRCHEISEAKQPILDFLMQRQATTLDGFRAKALVARWYAPADGDADSTDLSWMVHRSLTDDLLAGRPPIDISSDVGVRS